MTEAQFKTACLVTAELLLRDDHTLVAARQPDHETRPGHLLWMLLEAQGFYAGGKTEKANRWLGFVQGSMAADGYATVEELKRANMPPDEVFDGGRV